MSTHESNSTASTLDRRTFLRGAVATGVLGIAGGTALTACTPKQEAEANAEEMTVGREEVTQWVDAVSGASLVTNLYTNLTAVQLQDAVNAYQTECVVATTNEDGSPNIAIFVPAGMIEETFLAFTWAENQTKANFTRGKIGMIALDVPNPAAETKEQRHQGAVVRAEIVDDEAEIERLEKSSEMFKGSTFVKIVEVRAIG